MTVVTQLQREAAESIEDCRTMAHNITILANELRQAQNSKEEQRLTSEMKTMVEDSKIYISQTKRCLQDLDLLVTKRKDVLSNHERAYCTTVLHRLSDDFSEAVKGLLTSQTEFEAETRKKVSANLGVMMPEISPKERQDLVDGDPKKLQQALAAKQRIDGTASLTEQVSHLNHQQRALDKLSASVLELEEIFFYLSTLVDKQADQLKNIEEHVNNTVEYTGAAVIALESAEKHQESYETKRAVFTTGGYACWYCAIATVVVVCICLICYVYSYISALRKCLGCGGESGASKPDAAAKESF